MRVNSITRRLVVDPLAIIVVTVHMSELASAVGAIVTPLPFVDGAVGPSLDAVAVSEA